MKETDLRAGDVQQLATGFTFVEGPVWDAAGGRWLFSDIPENRIHTVTPGGEVGILREPSGNSNGLTIDGTRRLIACEHGNRRVSVSPIDGDPTVLADRFEGRRLNSPNDVVTHSSGAVYFTDPPYGIQPDEQEQPCCGVYRVAPDGRIQIVTGDLDKPNGLAFSPDESILYVADSEHEHLRAFRVAADGYLSGGEVFADLSHEAPGCPDGLKVDAEGNVYTANALGVWVNAPSGDFLGLISTPEIPANLAWGEDGKTLLVTARTSVYTVRMEIAGAPS
jgi:gluconolactonase